MREDFVKVRTKDGGAAAFCSGHYGLKLASGEIATAWIDGAPLTRAEFAAVLEPLGIFDIAEEVIGPDLSETNPEDVEA